MTTPSPARALALLLALCAGAPAHAGCDPLRFGYSNQARPPYYYGSGADVPARPGAVVDLIQEIAASAGCPVQLQRIPLLRLTPAMEAGTIDAMSVNLAPVLASKVFAVPRDAQGQPDKDKALRMLLVVYVRASDGLSAKTDPSVYFKTHKLGTSHGSPYVGPLRQEGIEIDDGAVDTARNLGKLRLGRIDGYLTVVYSTAIMDHLVAATPGAPLVRLEKPLQVQPVWLAVTQDYYERNRPYVEAMWSWLAVNGQARMAALMSAYDADPPDRPPEKR